MFVGCEGESERSYGAFLTRLIEEGELAVHLDTVVLQPGGGDPCAIVELAVQRIAQKQKNRGEPYDRKIVLLDADRLGAVPDRDQRLLQISRREDLHLVWQRPCHEAMLLRHIDGCAQLAPPDSTAAVRELRRRWDDYRKGMSAARLAERLDLDAVARAAAVENDLAVFLAEIGLVP
ncbi:MAG: RloB domain-containing protein [Burkholderiaceae bacterium]